MSKRVAHKSLLYGFHAVTAKLRHNPSVVREIYMSSERHDARACHLSQRAEQLQIRVLRVPVKRLDGMLSGVKHQGVIATVSAHNNNVQLDDVLDTITSQPARLPFLLILDGVTDPRNLGACLRVADAVGVHAVITPKNNSASLNEVAVKTSSGAAEKVPLCSVTNLARTLRNLRERNIHIIGMADSASSDLYASTWPDSCGVAWVMGAEDKGLRRLTREHCDQLLSIPMDGSVSSLNVSVAAGVCLFEARRRTQSIGLSR